MQSCLHFFPKEKKAKNCKKNAEQPKKDEAAVDRFAVWQPNSNNSAGYSSPTLQYANKSQVLGWETPNELEATGRLSNPQRIVKRIS
jgi:hypothetical protein